MLSKYSCSMEVKCSHFLQFLDYFRFGAAVALDLEEMNLFNFASQRHAR